MSRSRKTDLARKLHQGARSDRQRFNAGERSEAPTTPWWKLCSAGFRWGNHRRFKANEKVLARRVARKDAAAELRNTTLDQE